MPAAQKAREARRRKREAELEALRREREAMERAIEREVEELVSKLIELDRDIAHALYSRWTESDNLDEIRSASL
jgi:DNA-binding GntR family transcriptional regulator